MKILIYFCLILVYSESFAQKFFKTDFENSLYFTDNKDDRFYKSDTIDFVKVVNISTAESKKYAYLIFIDYNGCQNYSEFSFYPEGKLNIVDHETDRQSDGSCITRDDYSHWDFNTENQKLTIKDGDLQLSFIISSFKTDSLYYNNQLFDLKIIRLLRKK